jgi:hypothetical protein
MSKAEISIKASGECTFTLTESNEKKLRALSMYMRVVEEVSRPKQDGEPLCIDGLMNTLIDQVTEQWIKDLVKKHGFMDSQDFVSIACACKDEAELFDIIQKLEKCRYIVMYKKILEQIPIPDKQKDLPFEETADEN